jgi:hypothetical protein
MGYQQNNLIQLDTAAKEKKARMLWIFATLTHL